MAMQLYIADKTRMAMDELQSIDSRATEGLKIRQGQVISILHNQEQIENAANATLAKMLKMETETK